jgi:hypothetical protein
LDMLCFMARLGFGYGRPTLAQSFWADI